MARKAKRLTARQEAVLYAEQLIGRATDWQEVASALWDDDTIGQWMADEGIAPVSIVREAERRLGNKLPATYSD